MFTDGAEKDMACVFVDDDAGLVRPVAVLALPAAGDGGGGDAMGGGVTVGAS